MRPADWYARSLVIREELGDRPRMAFSHGHLRLLAEARGGPGQALEWTVEHLHGSLWWRRIRT
jgi:hypothetical protein